MRYPEFLKPGGTIGFIAPSFGCVTEPYHSLFLSALDCFEKAGYKTVTGPNCFSSEGIGKSNTPEACGREINDFFTNGSCDIILSCGGGETMCEDLPFVDFEAIKKAAAKWYMGYSDNTNLTFILPTLCDTAAVYGPCAPSFGQRPRHESLDDAFNLLCGLKNTVFNYPLWEIQDPETDNPYEPYNVTEPFNMKVVTKDDTERASFSGRLLGGCLDCLSILCGTRFDAVGTFNENYKNDGVIWFLEACDLTPMGIHRALWQLDNAGWFERASGFIIGRPYMYGADGMGYDRQSAVTSVLAKYGVPILLDTDIGHLPPMMPMVSGALAAVTAENNKLRIDYKFE